MGKLLASSPSLDGIIKQISRYYYGSTIHLEGEKVFNLKGEIKGVRVIEKRGRYRFEEADEPKKNVAASDAYWIDPDGEIYEVDQKHITSIVTDPEYFGLTKAYITKVYKKHKEPVGGEGNAREEIMAALIAMGWVRARYVRGDDSWTFQVRSKTDFPVVMKLSKHLLKKGASEWSAIVVIDLGGFRLDNGDTRLGEVATGALEERRKKGQFAQFLNPSFTISKKGNTLGWDANGLQIIGGYHAPIKAWVITRINEDSGNAIDRKNFPDKESASQYAASIINQRITDRKKWW